MLSMAGLLRLEKGMGATALQMGEQDTLVKSPREERWTVVHPPRLILPLVRVSSVQQLVEEVGVEATCILRCMRPVSIHIQDIQVVW